MARSYVYDGTNWIKEDEILPLATEANNISYDNTESGLSAENVQDAIDELADEKVDKEAGKGLFSGSYDDLTNRPQIPSIPSGTNNGDILVWDVLQNKYVSKPKWQMIYQPVEYIEGTGTQWIDTKLLGVDGVDVDFQWTKTNYGNRGCRLFDSLETHNSIYYGAYLYIWSPNNICQLAQPFFNLTPYTYDNNRHTIKFGSWINNIIVIDGEQVASEYSIRKYESPTSCMRLLREVDSSASSGFAEAKIYSIKFYIGSTIARDLIPVYNIYTGEVGMFDTVEGKFYGNNGSGTFLKGADV